MKLSLKLGIPLLVLLLLGVGATEGTERVALLILAMGVALWCAFSLPHPKAEQETDEPAPPGAPEDRSHSRQYPPGNGSGKAG